VKTNRPSAFENTVQCLLKQRRKTVKTVYHIVTRMRCDCSRVFVFMTGFIGLFDTARDYILQFTVT
jgi:hypothetical protein